MDGRPERPGRCSEFGFRYSIKRIDEDEDEASQVGSRTFRRCSHSKPPTGRFICTVSQIKLWQDAMTSGDLQGKHILFTLIALLIFSNCASSVKPLQEDLLS